MTDRISPEKRSWNMSRIRGKDTGIEVKVRKYLFSKGFRYRKNDPRLPGKPDIVLPKFHTVIFIHGCFWHRHKGCKNCTIPKTRMEFWNSKFKRNVENDLLHRNQLEDAGWNVLTIWECSLDKEHFSETMRNMEEQLYSYQKTNQEPEKAVLRKHLEQKSF